MMDVELAGSADDKANEQGSATVAGAQDRQTAFPQSDTPNRPNIKRKRRPDAIHSGLIASPRSHGRQGSTSTVTSSPRRSHRRGQLSRSSLRDENLSYSGRTGADGGAYARRPSHADGLQYGSEGPGQRVGYGDMTAIDWIFEYTKERHRLRSLYSSTSGVVGYLRQLLDSSQIWAVLIATGVAAGIITACIDIASDWLGDLKTGYCSNGPGGGRFYLNKGFCCWGLEEWLHCQDWTPWSVATHVRSSVGNYIVEYIFFVVLSVACAVAAAILVAAFATYARHSGIPEIKTVLGGFIIQRFMGGWTLLVKSLGLCLAVSSGLWLGKEGPLVHVACCCANLLMKFFGNLSTNEARKREVLSAAAAAGISVAFGSPIGGVLFSLEQLSYYFPDKTMWQSFVCAMVAAVTLQAFDPFRTGKLVQYQVTYSRGWHDFETVPFALLGVIGGLYGGLFIRLNMKVASWRKSARHIRNPLLEVFLVALVTALINYPNVLMRAQSSELVYSLFAECSAVPDDQFGLCVSGSGVGRIVALLLMASVLGFGLASVTFGLDIPAGIILPSMAIGALYGRALGITMEVWQRDFPDLVIFSSCEADVPCVTPSTYAIIGAASALGGVTRMTVSIVVIMFELTGALDYVLPIMIAVMISKWVGDAMGKRGIYESWIDFNEYPFLDNRDDAPAPISSVSEVMTPVEDLLVLPSSGHTIRSLRELLVNESYRGFPVVSDSHDSLLVGYISRAELIFALESALGDPTRLPPETEAFFFHPPVPDADPALNLKPWMDQTPITLSSKSSFRLTRDMFEKLGLRYVLLCDKGILQGLLTKKDLWYILDKLGERGSERDLLSAAPFLGEEPPPLTSAADEVGDGPIRSLMSPEMLLAMYNPKETWVGFPPAEAYNLSVYLEAVPRTRPSSRTRRPPIVQPPGVATFSRTIAGCSPSKIIPAVPRIVWAAINCASALGRPMATAPSARASSIKEKNAGPDPHSAVLASMAEGGRYTTRPMRLNTHVTKVATAGGSLYVGVATTVMDSHMRDAVLGMARTMRHLPSAPGSRSPIEPYKISSICDAVTPAQMLIKTLPFTASAMAEQPRLLTADSSDSIPSPKTVDTICGLQHSKTTSACRTPRRLLFSKMANVPSL